MNRAAGCITRGRHCKLHKSVWIKMVCTCWKKWITK